MKKLCYSVICLAFTFAFAPEEKTSNVQYQKVDYVSEYALPLDSAMEYRNRLDSAFAKKFHRIPVRGYTMRFNELLKSVGMNQSSINFLVKKGFINHQHARIYLGLDRNKKFRAFLVPVDGADLKKKIPGQDVIFTGSYWRQQANNGVLNEGDYVLDFTMPCPNSCDTNSPFYQPVPNSEKNK